MRLLDTSFPTHASCRLCPAWAEATRVGIATTHVSDPWPRRGHLYEYHRVTNPETGGRYGTLACPALLVLGQNPGSVEDITGLPFVGPSGQLLRDVYLGGIDAYAHASIYLTNSVRCGPHSITNVGPHGICFKAHTLPDLATITSRHPRTAVLLVSAPAVRAFYHTLTGDNVSQKTSFGLQGQCVSLPLPGDGKQVRHGGGEVTTYSTIHPAAVIRRRRLIHVVNDHLTLLSQWLNPQSLPTHPPLSLIPPRSPQ